MLINFEHSTRIASRDCSRVDGAGDLRTDHASDGETSEQDLFRSRLDQIIDMKHALVKLARTIDWVFGAVYTDKPGPAAIVDAADGGLALSTHIVQLNVQ